MGGSRSPTVPKLGVSCSGTAPEPVSTKAWMGHPQGRSVGIRPWVDGVGDLGSERPRLQALLPWQAWRLEGTSSLLNGNKDGGILCLFYLKSKQFLLCLMSKRFCKHCRENMTQLHFGDFQPVFLAVAAEQRMGTQGAAPHTLPGLSGGGQGSGGCSQPGAKGNSREEETLIRMEPFSLTRPVPTRVSNESIKHRVLPEAKRIVPQVQVYSKPAATVASAHCPNQPHPASAAHHTALGLKKPFFILLLVGTNAKFICA